MLFSRRPARGLHNLKVAMAALSLVIFGSSGAQAIDSGLTPNKSLGFTNENFAEVVNWLGPAVQIRHLYLGRQNWAKFQSTYTLDLANSFIAGDPSRRNAVISVPLFADGGNYAGCLAGDYDSIGYTPLADNIQRVGPRNVIIRLGWEMTFGGFPWGIGYKTTNNAEMMQRAQQFKSCFRRIVQIIRSKNPEVKFEFNVGGNIIQTAIYDAMVAGYPGDDVVTYIGIDKYDNCFRPYSSLADLRARCFDLEILPPLNKLRAFAAQHGKKMAISEWGLSDSQQMSNGHAVGAGDHPAYVLRMNNYATNTANNVAYFLYFNSDSAWDSRIYPVTQFPNAQYRMKSLYP